MRIGLIGKGAVGGAVVRAIEEGMVAGVQLSGVLRRASTSIERQELIEGSDLIVDAAGHAALAIHGPVIVGSGVDLLVVSVGALVDDQLFTALSSGPGRLLVSTGAIGGLDLLRAAELMGPLKSVSLESIKRPHVLVQPWMDEELVERLRSGRDRVEAFSGSARDAAQRFPQSANVAATLGLATVGLDAVRVSVVGDPAIERVRHRITAAGPAGYYEFTIENNPSPTNPRTSGVTPYSVLRALQDLQGGSIVGI